MTIRDFEPLPQTPQGEAVTHEIAAMALRSAARFGRPTVTADSISEARKHALAAAELDPKIREECAILVTDIDHLTPAV